MKMGFHGVLFSLGVLELFLCLAFLSISRVHSESELRHYIDKQARCDFKKEEMITPTIANSDQLTAFDIYNMAAPPDDLVVTFKWKGHGLEIVLHKDQEVSSPTVVSEMEDDGTTTVENLDTSCTYQGYVRGHNTSDVALSTCGGLNGYIQTDEDILFIMSDKGEDVSLNSHIVYTCEESERIIDPVHSEAELADLRLRRSAQSTRYVEIKVVVDHTVVKTAGSKSKATTYVMTLMNIANTAYQHRSLGQKIQLAIVKIVFLPKSQQRLVFASKNPDKTLSLYCDWAKKNRNSDRYDVSMLFTEGDFGPSGYAPVGVMCQQNKNCFAVRDDGFTSGFIIAHELGHVFGLDHDNQQNSCKGQKYKKTIMSPVVVSTFNHFWWSDCSKNSLASRITSMNCLDNRPQTVDNHYTLTASQELEENLGLAWSLDYQCRKDFGQDYEFCKNARGDPCKGLVCNNKKTNGCFTRNGIPLPGTNCAPNKKCYNMKCVEMTELPDKGNAVNGTWTAWSSWSACNTGCGVGIKKRSRSCHFPEDVIKGYDCVGDANEWTTCVDNTCKTREDKRAKQCAKWDKTAGVSKFVPYVSQNVSMRCLQTCKALPSNSLFVKQLNVADGTPCTDDPQNYDICVNGKCINVGCDGVINSSAKPDKCGVCNGDGTDCKTITGKYNKARPPTRRYSKVLRIPAGARQVSVMKANDGRTFLALKDGSTYKLNGNQRYISFTQFKHKGSTFYYTFGNSTHLEMIATSGPLKSPIDVMVYVGGRVNTLEISYNFTMPKGDNSFEKAKFKWKFNKWSPCSVTCGSGTKQTTYDCFDKDANAKTEDSYCAVLKSPRIDKSKCSKQICRSTNFSYKWKAKNEWTSCDAQCDESGKQTRKYQCQKMNGSRVVEDVEDRFCANVQNTVQTRNCVGSCTVEWEAGAWSECSVTCGTGQQQRPVFCGDPDTDEDDYRCTEEPPAITKTCEMPSCTGGDAGECQDRFSFCILFSYLAERCRHHVFRSKCCHTCLLQDMS